MFRGRLSLKRNFATSRGTRGLGFSQPASLSPGIFDEGEEGLREGAHGAAREVNDVERASAREVDDGYADEATALELHFEGEARDDSDAEAMNDGVLHSLGATELEGGREREAALLQFFVEYGARSGARFAEDLGTAQESLEGDVREAQDRVGRSGDRDELIFRKYCADEALRRLWAFGEPEVDAVFAHEVEHGVRVPDFERYVRPGERTAQRSEQPRNQVAPDRRARADRDARRQARAQRFDDRLDLALRREHAGHALSQTSPFRCQTNSPGEPVTKPEPALLLELRQLFRDRRLAHSERTSGGAQAARLGDAVENAELIQIHCKRPMVFYSAISQGYGKHEVFIFSLWLLARHSSAMASGAETRWIVTANFTADGSVAYRRADGTWSSRFSDAEAFLSEAETTEIVKRAAQLEQRLVSDPYAIDVGFGPNGIFPNTARERIRAEGPTVPVRRQDPGPVSRARGIS